jgi:hypothetical protein
MLLAKHGLVRPVTQEEVTMPEPEPIAEIPVRYIKLGPGGAWAKRCIAAGVMEYSPRAIPAEL